MEIVDTVEVEEADVGTSVAVSPVSWILLIETLTQLP